jgi:hypothetical protein
MKTPTKIWITEAEAQHYEEPAIIAPHKEIQYIRADLVDELVEALEQLHAEQNGPPLEKYKTSWQEAMQKAEVALAKIKEGECVTQ